MFQIMGCQRESQREQRSRIAAQQLEQQFATKSGESKNRASPPAEHTHSNQNLDQKQDLCDFCGCTSINRGHFNSINATQNLTKCTWLAHWKKTTTPNSIHTTTTHTHTHIEKHQNSKEIVVTKVEMQQRQHNKP